MIIHFKTNTLNPLSYYVCHDDLLRKTWRKTKNKIHKLHLKIIIIDNAIFFTNKGLSWTRIVSIKNIFTFHIHHYCYETIPNWIKPVPTKSLKLFENYLSKRTKKPKKILELLTTLKKESFGVCLKYFCEKDARTTLLLALE